MLPIFNPIKTRQIEIRRTAELVIENKNCDLQKIQLTKGVCRVIAPTPPSHQTDGELMWVEKGEGKKT